MWPDDASNFPHACLHRSQRLHGPSNPVCSNAIRRAVPRDAMSTFVAIDFETATTRRDSACAVGLAAGCDGRIVVSRTYLIRPPSAQFTFTDLHGLGWKDVRDAPTFAELWPTLRDLDRRRGVCRRPQRAVRPERPARLLRAVPAASAAGVVHLHRATRPHAVGDPPDEAASTIDSSSPKPERWKQ